jgi:hypothetical protein
MHLEKSKTEFTSYEWLTQFDLVTVREEEFLVSEVCVLVTDLSLGFPLFREGSKVNLPEVTENLCRILLPS